jgi:NAD(P)H-hydrate epimerase
MARLPTLPKRAPDANKGDCGRILIVAGSRGMAGAAALASDAAYRAGAGLVLLAVPDSLLETMSAKQTCAIVVGLPDERGSIGAGTAEAVARLAEVGDVLAIGPGLGRSDTSSAEIRKMIRDATKPVVLDADGLNAFEGQADGLAVSKAPRILTPHPGELGRLMGATTAAINRARRRTAEAAAKRFKAVVVLKGRGTIVSDGRRTETNTTGNAGMATGGAGDVLTGVIAGLLGQGMKPFDAARLGVHLHGRAGDLAAEKLGQHSLMATDLLDYLPAAFLEHERSPR